MDSGWRDQAACLSVGGDWWFPETGERVPAMVLHVCSRCPVRLSCLDYALRTEPSAGIWAGCTAREVFYLRQGLLDGQDRAQVQREGIWLGGQDTRVVYYSGSPERWSPTTPPAWVRRDRKHA